MHTPAHAHTLLHLSTTQGRLPARGICGRDKREGRHQSASQEGEGEGEGERSKKEKGRSKSDELNGNCACNGKLRALFKLPIRLLVLHFTFQKPSKRDYCANAIAPALASVSTRPSPLKSTAWRGGRYDAELERALVPSRHEDRHEERGGAKASENDERVPGVGGSGGGRGGGGRSRCGGEVENRGAPVDVAARRLAL